MNQPASAADRKSRRSAPHNSGHSTAEPVHTSQRQIVELTGKRPLTEVYGPNGTHVSPSPERESKCMLSSEMPLDVSTIIP